MGHCAGLLSRLAALLTWRRKGQPGSPGRELGYPNGCVNGFITIRCTLSLLLLVKLASRTTWRPARTVLGIGRKGQSTNVDKRKLQQNESDDIKKLRDHKGPGQRQDSLELSPRHNNPCFKHAQTTDQPWLKKTDPERDKHCHKPNKKRKRLCVQLLF